MGLEIVNFIEGTEQAKLGRGVSFSVAQCTAMLLAPGRARAVREKNADGIG